MIAHDGMDVEIADHRMPEEPCERGTVGCSVLHDCCDDCRRSRCETW